MMNIDSLEQMCPECQGSGRIENSSWSDFWTLHGNLKNWFRTLDIQEQVKIGENMLQKQPAEPMFFICKRCKGKGKLLTDDGEKIVRFLRFWLNDNY